MFINLGVSANCPTQSGASTHTKLCGAIFSAVEASALAQTRTLDFESEYVFESHKHLQSTADMMPALTCF